MLRKISKILAYICLSALAVLFATMGFTQTILTYVCLSALVVLFAAMGFSRKTLTYVCLSIVVVLFAAMGFSQTTLFRQTLRATIYKIVDANLNASVFIGEIKGNLFTGISIDTIAIYVNDAPFLEAGRTVVRYDPLPLWNKNIALGSIEIEHPSVSIIRFADGTWNVDRLAKKKSEPDSLPSPWVVAVKNLRINNGHFRLIDSTAQSNHDLPDSIAGRTFNFSNLDIEKLNVELSATFSEQQQSASIKNISFVTSREGFTLTHFSGDLRHTAANSEVKNLLIVTPRSRIEFSAKISSVDALKIHDIAALQFTPVECSLSPSTVAAEDLQRFLPSLNFLRGSVQLECRTEGEFGNLKVKRLHAGFNRSIINLDGSVTNLHHPDDLTLNIESKGTTIHPSDVPQLLPFFHIPDFGNAGELGLDFHYVGKPLNFQVTANASMAAGNVSVNGGLDLTGTTMRYKAAFGGTGVNLGKILSAPSLRSSLDFSGTIEGEGTSIEELNSKASLIIDSSSFNDIPLSHLRTEIIAADKKISCSAKLQFPKGDVALQSALEYNSAGAPSYSFDGTFSHFDFAAIFHDDHYASDCSFSLSASGKDFLREDMSGNLRVGFSNSRFETYTFDSARAELHVGVDSSGSKTIGLVSPIADVSMTGNFTYAGVIDMLKSHIAGFRRAYYKQRAIFDSSFVDAAGSVNADEDTTAGSSPSPQNTIQYSVHVRNLEPVAIFFGMNIFNAVGDIEGSIHGNADTLSAEGSVSIMSAKYSLNNDGYVVVEKGLVEYSVQNMARDNLLAAANSPTVQIRASGANVFTGESYFRNASVEFSLHDRHAEYSVQCEVDSTIKLGIEGRAHVTPDEYELTFDTFSFSYQGYELDNARQFSARLSGSGISVDSTAFIHQDEKLIFGGSIGYGGEIAAFVRLQDFALSNIYHFGKSQNFKSNAIAFGGTVNASGLLRGTMHDPVLTCELGITDFAYRGVAFGFVNSSIHYENKVADCTVQLSKTPESHDNFELLCSGSIPMDLAFASVDNRFSLAGMDMYVKAQNFDISVLDPFIEQLDEMEGTMEGSIHCTGSLESPLFDGGMELRDAKFLFPMNNMKYRVDGKIDFQGNKVSFSTFVAKNLTENYSTGKIDFSGYITLRGFVPDEYHLRAKGELKVLQEASRKNDQGVYGDLIASTGDEGLSFDGTAASSRVTGAMYIKQASLTFPSTRESANLVSARYVNVVSVDDTSKAVPDSLLGSRLFAFLGSKKEARTSNDPSFLDGLGYNLTIQTQGIVQIRMIFNAATNEELFADLNGKLELSKEKNDVRLTGTINVSDKSNYKFYKQFDASGTLKFTGKPDNPELDITASYTGSHLKPETAGQKETTVPATEKVVVSLAISGTRYDPKIKIGLSTFDDNNNETVRTGDVESDAISFLLTSTPGSPGKFRDDLTSNDKQGIASSLGGSIGGSLVSGFTNTLLSGMMQDFLRANNFTALSNVEILYSGTSPDLRLSGVVGNAYWTFGGKVFNDINNANVSVQWSLGSIIQDDNLRNFMFEVDRKSDPMETIDLRRPTNGARVYYKFAF